MGLGSFSAQGLTAESEDVDMANGRRKVWGRKTERLAAATKGRKLTGEHKDMRWILEF